MNDTLTRFGDDLVRAIARELSSPEPARPPRRPLRRRRVLLVAAAACALAVAAACLALVRGDGDSPRSAWERHVLRAAQVALPGPAPNTIVHVSVTQTMTPAARGDGALLVPTVDAEGWFQQGPPWRSTTRERLPGHRSTWQTDSRVYDPASRRIYLAPSLPSGDARFTLVRSGRRGDYVLRVATARGPIRETVTAAQARALRTGADGLVWEGAWDGHRFSLRAVVTSRARSPRSLVDGSPRSTSLTFPAQLHRLLDSGRARVAGRVTVAGRAAIEIAISGVSGYERVTYDVDPITYRPVELDLHGPSRDDVTRLVFHAYQVLSSNGHAGLPGLHAPAGTRVDRAAAGFYRHLPALLLW